MSTQPGLAIVTGANGFLGSRIASRLKRQGWEVRCLQRKPRREGEFRFELGGGWDEAAFETGGSARGWVIHCAHALEGASPATLAEINYRGTLELYRRVESARGLRFAYVSSMAAHPGARSFYGLSKLRVERELDLSRALVIKPGTIVGSGGLFAKLLAAMAKTPVIPLFYGEHRLQTIGVSELCEAMTLLLEREKAGVIPLAHPEPVSVREFYLLLAQASGRKPLLLPFPGNWVYPFLRVAEKIGLRLPVTSENLLGLRFVSHFDTVPVLKELGIQVRNYRESLQSEIFSAPGGIGA